MARIRKRFERDELVVRQQLSVAVDSHTREVNALNRLHQQLHTLRQSLSAAVGTDFDISQRQTFELLRQNTLAAISGQHRVLADSEKVVAQARERLRAAHRQTETWRTLEDNAREVEHDLAQRAEQRAIDDIVDRAAVAQIQRTKRPAGRK